MKKTEYKAGFVLLGGLILMVGLGVNHFSTEITNMFLAIDTAPLTKGPKSYSILQTEGAEIAIKIISVLADIALVL